MKKNLILVVILCLIQASVSAQILDSTKLVLEVDSLIRVSWTLTEQKDLDQALAVNAAAEKWVLEKLGTQSAAYGSICFNKARILDLQGDLAGAERWHLESIAIREKVIGKENSDYASGLNNLGNLYYDLRNFEKAESLYIESKTIREKVLGKDHPDYAVSLNNLANTYSMMHDYKKAEPLHLEALAIREKVLGRENPRYIGTLESLGNLYYDMSNYEKASQFYLEVKVVREKVFGKENPDYAWMLNNLANTYSMLGEYEKAEPLDIEAKDIWEKVHGKEHPRYVGSLNNLANLYFDMGNYEKAELLYLEAKSIQEKSLGKETPSYAWSLSNLGNTYWKKGDYEKAESFHLKAKAIREKVLGKEHLDYGSSLQNLANLHFDMGNYEKAELFNLEAKSIFERGIGRDNPTYAWILQNLANVYWKMKKYDKAETLQLEAMAIREKILGKEHLDYSSSLLNLANLYYDMGDYPTALKYQIEAKTIRKKKWTNEHPEYPLSLNNLANIYWKMGDYDKAESLHLEAKSRWEKLRGKEHPNYALSVTNLANLYCEMGEYEKAEPLFEELISLNKSLMNRALHHLSEREMNNYSSTFSETQNKTLFAAQASLSQNSRFPQICFDNTLFYKGFLLNAVSQIKGFALSDTASTEKFKILKSSERRLAREYSRPIAERDSTQVAKLQDDVNILQKQLAQTVAGYGEAMRQVRWQEVQSALKPDESAIEFVHYTCTSLNLTDSIMYAALVLRPGEVQPYFIPLFEENEIKPILRGAAGGNNFLRINALYMEKTPDSKTKSLFELIWKPLENLLIDTKTVYCAPSGLLHRINISAIPISGGMAFGDSRQMVVLGSTRQMVVPNKIQTNNNTAYLAGGIRYDSDSTVIAYANRGASSRSVKPSDLAFQPDSLSITRGGVLDYLPATAAEVREIGQTLSTAGFQTKLDTGFYATEESFRQLGVVKSSPRIIHLATHGYFFPDPVDGGRKPSALGSEREPVFKMSDHPMIRSGLILAGAKQAWLTGKHPEGQEDGILTAYEISQMNLSGTELVVLSACETGLGDIVGNEGVYGLQRAFKIAGAKYLIMSLWKVDDQSTRVFMTNFYRHWLTEKQTVPQAFRSTQQEMRAKYSGAYDWAGFVLIE